MADHVDICSTRQESNQRSRTEHRALNGRHGRPMDGFHWQLKLFEKVASQSGATANLRAACLRSPLAGLGSPSRSTPPSVQGATRRRSQQIKITCWHFSSSVGLAPSLLLDYVWTPHPDFLRLGNFERPNLVSLWLAHPRVPSLHVHVRAWTFGPAGSTSQWNQVPKM